ncbi:TIGR02270 family protein [Uliginosibacterium sp. 31-16]|uniref:TIGR02270 family protein n=1 Tax=Uliginosibacterium sp. 31-16 TaxID=3068315 RepID=UPI00273E7B54|nr:TIGR02270 family protein [Uliginosibacterium sp. 31-16]MDP5240090.1 TIGR02270 family protein [Uliginosibacterium sp. 31-16]
MIATILTQHTEDAALLYLQRRAAVHAPHFALLYLKRLDERLAAHLDGLCVAAEEGQPWLREEDGELPGSLFAETVVALTAQPARLDALLARAAALPEELQAEVVAALGWVESNCLQGVVKTLLESPDAFHRRLVLEACMQHGANPGTFLQTDFAAEDPALRACAARAAGELGLATLREPCRMLLDDTASAVVFAAAYAAVLLGDRAQGLAQLGSLAAQAGPHQHEALRLWLLAANPVDAHNLLAQLARQPEQTRTLITASGIAGDPQYLPWLLQQMEKPALARLAAEAFALITGQDLAEEDLDASAPGMPEEDLPGPNDDAENEDLSEDPDDNLPWPDVAKLQAWWQANAARFPTGQPFFMGQPRSPRIALTTLREGYQRQRRLAALILALQSPDTALFNIAAPARRQAAALAAIS